MSESAYLAAKTVAAMIHSHFTRHPPGDSGRAHPPAASPAAGDGRSAEYGSSATEIAAGRFAPQPDEETIEGIVDAAFWASLRREEGYVPRISLAFVTPEDVPHPITLEKPFP